jgi:hypothetical protein
MLRIHRMFASSLAAFFLAGALAPSAANAWPLGRVFHLHPPSAQDDSRVSLRLYNKGQLFQDVQIEGHVYTVLPNQYLAIKAPTGTEIYMASTGMGHHKGDFLLAVSPKLKGETISIN